MQRNECSEHRHNPTSKPCRVCDRIKAETKVVKRLIKAALAKGWTVSVHDSEDWTLRRSSDAQAIFAACMTSDSDILHFRDKETAKGRGSVFLVYGNSGSEVVNDYSTSLEDFMGPINAYCDTLEN